MPDIKNLAQGAAELWIDGVNVGFTSEGVVQTTNKEFYDVMVEQVKGAIKTVMVSEDLTVSTALTEVTLGNLKTVWDQSNATLLGGTFLAIGTELGGNEHTLTIVVPAPTGMNFSYINYHFFKAVSYESTELNFQRAENTTIPITFKCLKDVNNDNRFGYITLSNTKGA